MPGAKDSLAALSRLGLPIIVVTNQAVVNRGLASARAVDDIHRRMVAEVAAHGGRIDRIIYCPHRPEEQCDCRKPEPGMLLQATEKMKIDLPRSYMVGDSATDLMAGQRAGCQTFLVLTGRGFQQLLPALHSMGGRFTVSHNLMGATTQILKAELSITDEADRWSPAYAGRYRQSQSTAGGF